jgi:hypothetical protein
MKSLQQASASVRQCVYCGKPVAFNQSQCPHCRETVPKVRLAPAPIVAKGSQVRRGILYMLLGLVIHFIALRSDSLNLPFSVNPGVSYLTTLLILGGLGLALYGMLNKTTA